MTENINASVRLYSLQYVETQVIREFCNKTHETSKEMEVSYNNTRTHKYFTKVAKSVEKNRLLNKYVIT